MGRSSVAMLMYLNRADAVSLLTRLRLLVPEGPIVLRETTVRRHVEVRNADYHVVYRTPTEYQEMAAEAGLSVKAVERNRGYADMEVAVELVNTARRIPPSVDVIPGSSGDRCGGLSP